MNELFVFSKISFRNISFLNYFLKNIQFITAEFSKICFHKINVWSRKYFLIFLEWNFFSSKKKNFRFQQKRLIERTFSIQRCEQFWSITQPVIQFWGPFSQIYVTNVLNQNILTCFRKFFQSPSDKEYTGVSYEMESPVC